MTQLVNNIIKMPKKKGKCQKGRIREAKLWQDEREKELTEKIQERLANANHYNKNGELFWAFYRGFAIICCIHQGKFGAPDTCSFLSRNVVNITNTFYIRQKRVELWSSGFGWRFLIRGPRVRDGQSAMYLAFLSFTIQHNYVYGRSFKLYNTWKNPEYRSLTGDNQ